MKRHMIRAAILAAALAATLGLSSQAFAFFDIEYRIDSFFDIEYEIGLRPVSASGHGTVRVGDPMPGAMGFDTEILSMDLGVTRGTGDPDFDLLRILAGSGLGIRPSLGMVGDPDFDLLYVQSFFDVFFDITLTNGQHLYNEQPAHFSGAADSFFDITYRLDQDVQLFGGGHVTVLKAGSTMHTSPEPAGFIALAGGLAPLAFALRRAIKR